MHYITITTLALATFVAAQTVPTKKEPMPPEMEKAQREARENPETNELDAELPRMIQCQFECVEVSHEDLTKMLFLRDQNLADATKLRKELQEMVAQNKAKVVDTMMVVARSGQKAMTESIQEYVYPTEYEPSEIPNSIEPPKKKITKEDIQIMEWMRTPPTPTAFDTRNVGGTLEVEPTLDADYKIVDLRFSWEVVTHHGEKSWIEYKDSLDNVFKVEMPKFYAKRVTTAITCTPGSYNLVGLMSPEDAQGVRDTSRKWFVFAKCEVQVVK